MMRKALLYLLFSCLAVLAVFPAYAEEDGGRFGVGVDYGIINNFKMWACASTETGSVLKVNYSYDFNPLYTAALEIGFIADENVFKNAAVNTYVETGTFFRVNHLFHTLPVGQTAPYLKIGTGIAAVNGWWKRNGTFTSSASNVFADINAGAGADFKLWNALLNVDLDFPGLFHEWYMGSRISSILSLGLRWRF
jgi:hypothetical protein